MPISIEEEVSKSILFILSVILIQISIKSMKTHRSLKNILQPQSKLHQQYKTEANTTTNSLNSSLKKLDLNLESISQHVPEQDHSHQNINHKHCHSQKQLDLTTFSLHRTLSKERPMPTTARTCNNLYNNHKDQNSTIISTKTPKYKHLINFQSSILTPAQTNINHQDQPKRPKILNRLKHTPSFFDEFKLGKMLGKGRFGNVFRVQHIPTNFLYAVKKISLQKLTDKFIDRLTSQIKIQSFVKHEHCLQLYKYYRQGDNLLLIIQLGDCSLFDKLRKRGYFTQVESCYYIAQTIRALLHLHSLGVIHRDLKPENIVLVNNTVKLADFGWAVYLGNNQKRSTFCGTLDYVSPEVIMGTEYDESVDAWSVGVLCYQLCTGHAPFQSPKNKDQTYRKILNVDLKYPRYLSDECRDFISRLLQRSPWERMNLNCAITHSWIKKYSMI